MVDNALLSEKQMLPLSIALVEARSAFFASSWQPPETRGPALLARWPPITQHGRNKFSGEHYENRFGWRRGGSGKDEKGS